jgi:hypothetical protein
MSNPTDIFWLEIVKTNALSLRQDQELHKKAGRPVLCVFSFNIKGLPEQA